MNPIRRRVTAVVAAGGALTLAGGAALLGVFPPGSAAAAAAPTATAAPAGSAKVTKVLMVIEENHSLAQMQAGMPTLAGWAKRYAVLTDETAIRHPSLPNYLALAGGTTGGVTNDNEPPRNTQPGQSVFGQALAAGLTAKTYAESMPGNCVTSGNVDNGYAVKHNPWAYYTGERAECGKYDVPASQFAGDAAADRLPNVGMLVPDKGNDAHDGTLATADGWLRRYVTPVLASSDFTSGRLAVVVTADEDDKSSGNRVLTVVMQAGLHGVTVRGHLTHYGLSRLLSEVSGSKPLAQAGTAADVASALGLDVGPGAGGGPVPTATPGPVTPTPTATGTESSTATASRPAGRAHHRARGRGRWPGSVPPGHYSPYAQCTPPAKPATPSTAPDPAGTATAPTAPGTTHPQGSTTPSGMVTGTPVTA